MTATLLVIHVLLAVGLIAVILVQRSSSDGGGLMGGGGSSSLGGLMTVRGTANLLTRITSALATGFICTSLVLTILAGAQHTQRSIADQIPARPVDAPAAPQGKTPAPTPPTSTPAQPSVPAVPLSQ
jgi:preprotein translocase subunit SecG